MASLFQWQDPLLFDDLLQQDELLIQQSAANFARSYLADNVTEDYLNERINSDIFKAMGNAGLLGVTLDEQYGGIGASYVAYGLVTREIERVDSGYRSMLSVQSSLVIYPIMAFGSLAQQQHYLPSLTKGEMIGCFGLTESEAGSDPSSMRTKAKKIDGGYILHGEKAWISNAPIADIAIIWATLSDDDNAIRGFIVPMDSQGLSTQTIEGKLSLRTSSTGMIMLDNVRVGDDAILPNISGIKGPFSCLNRARYGIAWGVLGAAEDCWHRAHDYGMNRRQFNRPLAHNQLYQQKLVTMQTDITFGLLANLRVGRLIDDGCMAPEMVSIIKRQNCDKALQIARMARDMHGGNGIQASYHVMRHAQNLETVNTYEGTHDIHTLILGRAQTGMQAFY